MAFPRMRPVLRSRRWFRLLVLAVWWVLASAALTELAWRAFAWSRGDPHSRVRVEDAWRATLGELTDLPAADAQDVTARPPSARSVRLHPYVGFSRNPNGILLLEADDDDRPVELPLAPDPERFLVVVVGGSVAANFCRHGGAEILRERLESDALFRGRRIVVLNAAHGAYKQPQQLLGISYLESLGLGADAILNIDGFNETALAYENRVSRLSYSYPWVYHWRHLAEGSGRDPEALLRLGRIAVAREARRAALRSALAAGWARSAVLSVVVDRADRRREREVLAAEDAYRSLLSRNGVDSPTAVAPALGEDEALAGMADLWARGSELLSELASARGALYVHVLQPALPAPGGKPPSSAEAELLASARTWKRGAERGYPLLRERGAALAREGVGFHDLTEVFASIAATRYVDLVHFTRDGEREFAERVASAFLDTARARWGSP